MLDNSITATLDAESVTLNRINQDGYTGLFQGATASGNDLTLEVKHTVPKKPGASAEQHLAKLTYTEFSEVQGVLVVSRITSVHKVIKTTYGVESDTVSLNVSKALDSFLTDANVDKILDRRS